MKNFIIGNSLASSSSDSFNYDDFNHLSSSFDNCLNLNDNFENSSFSLTSSTESICNCNEFYYNEKVYFNTSSQKKSHFDCSWLDDYVISNNQLFYFELLDERSELQRSSINFYTNKLQVFKKRTKSMNWSSAKKLYLSNFNRKESFKKRNLALHLEENKKNQNKLLQNQINKLAYLVENCNSYSSNDNLDKLKVLGKDVNDYIKESENISVFFIELPNKHQEHDYLIYSYSKPCGKAIDTDNLDDRKLINLKGMHITMANIIKKITTENLKKASISIPRVSFLRRNEKTDVDLYYIEEEEFLLTFASNKNTLVSTQLSILSKIIYETIKFKWKTIRDAFCKLENRVQLHNYLHLISFLLYQQEPFSSRNLTNNLNELTIELNICKQLTLNIELMECIQKQMLNFEYFTWINDLNCNLNELKIENNFKYFCISSAIFYKGMLICSNVYKNCIKQNLLISYLKLNGFISLSAIAKIKLVKWIQVYNDETNLEDSYFLLLIIFHNLLYCTVWEYSSNKNTNNETFKLNSNNYILPKFLIGQGFQFVKNLVLKTDLIDEIDCEYQMQTYWYALPISLEEFKKKKGHLLQKSFHFWNNLQNNILINNYLSNSNENLNRKLFKTQFNSIKRNLNTKYKYTKFRTSYRKTFHSIYNSLRSKSNLIMDYQLNDKLKFRYNALSRSLKQVRMRMVDYLVCYLVLDRSCAIYQAPILSKTLFTRLGNLFFNKFRLKCIEIKHQVNQLDNVINEFSVNFDVKVPKLNFNLNTASSFLQSKNLTFKSSYLKQGNTFENTKSMRFWLHFVRLDSEKEIYLCFIDDHFETSSIETFINQLTWNKV